MPSHYYDDEWQAQQREKTKELHRRRREEEEEEERKIEEYREVGMRLKGYPEEDVRKARILVSSFIRAVDEVEETEILKREATPAMRLLNDLLITYDGFNFDEWLNKCKKIMSDTFPREDPYSILVPPGFESFDLDKHQGPWRPSLEIEDNTLLRVDFVREVDELLQEVRLEQDEEENEQELDPESVANKLKQQEKQQTIRQVEALLDLAISLKW